MLVGKLSLSELLTELGRARKARVGAYEMYKEYRAYEDELREQLGVLLREQNLRSAKGADFMASFVSKPRIIIQHEQSVIDWLKNTPDIEADLYIGIKTDAFQGLAKSLYSNEQRLIPGTEIETTESLAIKSNKQKG